MFETGFTYQGDTKDDFKIRMFRDADWKSSKHRLLIILQTVDSEDLKARALLSGQSRTVLVNCIKHARKTARTFREDLPEFTHAVINFNNQKHLHLDKAQKAIKERDFTRRVQDLIENLDPTHVFVSGDQAMSNLFPELEKSNYKRGWVHNFDGRKYTSSLDLEKLYTSRKLMQSDEEDELPYVNLLGYFCSHLCNLMIGKLPYSLKRRSATPKYINTIEKFDSFYKKLRKSNLVSIDTETKNLSVLSNAIYIIQFALEEDPEVGYVIPIDHPLSPFTSEERSYIKKKLKSFFSKNDPEKELVFFNGVFDLRVIRSCLNIPIIWYRVWEITYGESLLDENLILTSDFGALQGNLAAVLCRYGNDFYYTASFSKKDRTTTGIVDPSDPGLLMYCATDCCCLLWLRQAQIQFSKHQWIEKKNWQPYFVRHMQYQMSDTVHQMSHLKEDGSDIDKDYIKEMISNKSPLIKEMQTMESEIRKFKSAKKANDIIIQQSGIKSSGLFGTPWALKLSKPSHLRIWFFDVMGLKPVTKTSAGLDSTGKEFLQANMDVKEIEQFFNYGLASKLMGTYIKGWYKKLIGSIDGRIDFCLRPDYHANRVVTGRLASEKPSLQQTPSRSALAKYIKRLFIARKGCLQIEFDYSAHEVRIWSVESGDKKLAGTFRVGQQLRQQYIQTPTEKGKAELISKGDIHIINVKRFFGLDVDKKHPLRDAIKAVIFGVLYGKSARTLGKDVKKDEKFAQGLIEKLFNDFKDGAKWMAKMKSLVESDLQVFSSIGRIRHLPGVLSGIKSVISAQIRRGSNSPIQGFASEIGVKASRLITTTYYQDAKTFLKFLGKQNEEIPRIRFNRIVHDALYYMVPYDMVIPFIHILQYQATYGIARQYEEQFGVDFTIEPEIEVGISGISSESNKWDWSLPDLISCIEKSLKTLEGLNKLDDEVPAIMKQILYPWKDKDFRRYLQDQYPLLGVKDLDEQIQNAIKPYFKKDKRHAMA